MPSPESILSTILSDFAAELKAAVANPPGSTAKARAWNRADAATRLAQVNQALIKLGKRGGLLVGPFIQAAQRKGIQSAYFQAKAALDHGFRTEAMTADNMDAAMKGTFSRVDVGAAAVLAQNTYNDIMKVARTTATRGGVAIKAMAQRGVTNEEVNGIITKGILRGQRDEPIRELQDALERIHGKTMTLIDKNGDPRETDTANYASLVVRTRTREATEESTHRRLQTLGLDLVVVLGPLSPDVCGDFVNKVFSLSGGSAEYPALSSTPGGGPPFHPNCRHVTSAFVPQLATDEQLAASRMTEDEKQLLGKSPTEALRIHKDLQLAPQNRVKDQAAKKSIGGTNLNNERTFKAPDLRNPDPHKM